MVWPVKVISLGIAVVALATLESISIRPKQAPDPGEELARQYCSSCHQFPPPEILTKRSWSYLLTDMGFRLGIVDYDPISSLPPIAIMHMTAKERILREGQVIPPAPTLSTEDWTAIREYYIDSAPRNPLPQEKKPRTNPKLDQFNLVIPGFQPNGAVFTLTRVDPESGGVVVGNQRDESLTILDRNLEIKDKHLVNHILVDMTYQKGSLYFLSIGDLMGQFIGQGYGYLHKKEPERLNFYRQDYLISDLHRPVDVEIGDLDADGSDEFVLSNFGDITGNVSLYRYDGTYLKELISAPGAIRSQIHDFNHDDKPDIMVLMGDARENFSLFLNQGEHRYQRKIVVECHSSYGHTYFELQDFNSDGYMDILAANGDTDADPFNTLKNYHGIRIYLNDGENNFEQGYFYPMYGAHFAKAADFDNDGDLDIAASAFFPDFSSEKPEQFVYLENQGDLDFQPMTHPETYQGRWMTLDIGDYDLDGDTDMVLGGGYLPLGMEVDYSDKYEALVENGKALLVFENRLY